MAENRHQRGDRATGPLAPEAMVKLNVARHALIEAASVLDGSTRECDCCGIRVKRTLREFNLRESIMSLVDRIDRAAEWGRADLPAPVREVVRAYSRHEFVPGRQTADLCGVCNRRESDGNHEV